MSKKIVYTIEVPDVHPSLNMWTKLHYIPRNTLKKQWMKDVSILAKQVNIPIFKAPVEIFITYYHPRETVDLDNYTPKFIIDGLKIYFGDDNVTRLKKIGWEFKKGEKRSVIQIRESK